MTNPQPAGSADEQLIESLTRIANDLERVIVGIFACTGLLGLIAFILILRLLMGR